MVERRLIAVEGVVQGVGFRPYVHRLAAANALSGLVRNDAGGVLIDVEGDASRIDEFYRLLTVEPPALATIGRMRMESATPRAYRDFSIAESDASARDRFAATIPPDAATCDACLAELFDAGNRRFGHAFITCTDCGPRFTIVHATPYDRERTSMAAFALCASCKREYDDPADRRFHAESIACPQCGPTLVAHGGTDDDARHIGPRAVEEAAAVLRAGGIVAIKALGGFHLACDATVESTVQRLRHRKHRPAKPFAVMVRDALAAALLCELSPAEREALESPARPVVLSRRRADAAVAESLAPHNSALGVMLPSTPLHHLLIAALERPLVMTSGNRGGEPVVTDEASAIAALGDIADLFLTHDREIAVRCDDSVVRIVAGRTRQVRRARGYVPQAIQLALPVPGVVLAVGGHFKNTVCVAHGASAQLSAHVGDLETAAARDAMRRTIDDALRIARVRPSAIAHDLHPEYASTRVAEAYAAAHDVVRRVPVQHHHAHVAACVAEFGVREPVIGVAFDGSGLGSDGAVWGGEFLVVDGARFTRCGHLGYVPLPGGDAAARRPWRSAAAHLARVTAGRATFRPPDIADDEWALVAQLIARPEHTPRTSSVGRLFDAVASLLGLCHVASFEGEAAMALESAAGSRVSSRYSITLGGGTCWTADPAQIIAGVVADLACQRDRAEIAAAFHGAMRDLVLLGCERIREETGLHIVVLSGGVFVNKLLAESALEALTARRFKVLLPRMVPCNDGGLSLGQAYVAACALREDPCA